MMNRSRYLSMVWAGLPMLALVSLSATSVGQIADTAEVAATPEHVAIQPDPRLVRMLQSPRKTMKSFIDSVNKDDLDKAALCLDLSELQAADEARTEKAREYAYKLKDVIDRITRVEYLAIPGDADYGEDYNLSEGHAIFDESTRRDALAIVVSRGEDDLWRFSKELVAQIDDLWERAQKREKVAGLAESQASKPPQVWLREQFPESLRQRHFLLRDYQWICLAVLIFIGFVADLLVRTLLHGMTTAWFRFMSNGEREKAEQAAWRPIGLLAQSLVWYGGTKLIDLPPMVLTVLFIGLKGFVVVAAIWTAFRLIDLLTQFLLRRTATTETRFDDLLVALVSKSLKTLAVCLGVILFAQMFDLDVWGVMGGLGIGGIAIAFAARDTLGNLFGSLTVLLDRPFEIGDWIVTEDVEGTVEAVGMRSTRIRTFYNSQITLPNSRMITAVVDNMGRRRYRRVKETLGLEYSTKPEQIDAFCEGVRELVRRHPHTRKDYFHVYFNGYGDSSLNILLYCFLVCPDWGSELHEKHRLLADIYRLAESLKISFAFPTRTVHLLQSDGVSGDLVLPKDPVKRGRDLARQIAKG